MPVPSPLLGQRHERAAERFLTARGLVVIARNYRCKGGEIDLIMGHESDLVFVEVRYRRSAAFGTAAETVTRDKQRRLVRAARDYLHKNAASGDRPCRFDVVGMTGTGSTTEFDWIQNAFTA